MQRALVFAVLFAFTCSARAGGDPVKDAPAEVHILSGKSVKLLSVTRTALHGSGEPALSVQYVTDMSLSDAEKLYPEVQQVFDAIRPIAEREKLHAAVVTANEPSSGLISVSRGAGWCWKQRADGSWGAPEDSDHSRVPK